ncbi:serine protease [Sphaerisporangium siamense]|uniref:Subtilisin family serine protease n=1 Tax=Sphaerisporangium siamense TaxID=795645 RepID=A0A7W7D8B0_9ACTN|nr:S8/S53 family peptidase [Sphaerisporangium siamense]MBB4702150.1 subtilisin family serine protease [Sphaerisporangium siamense]GII87157.1 serine protease [Sphaerisporangium siamense]
MDAQTVEHTPGRSALIRPGVLLSRSPTAAARWTQSVEYHDGVFVLRLEPGADPCELAATLTRPGHEVAPNHVVTGQPLFFGGPTGVPRPAPAPAYEPGEPSRVTVGLLDTGLAPHPWFQGRDWFEGQPAEVLDADGDGRLDRQAGHGTFIAGLLLGQAPGVRLRVARVLDSDGVGDEAGVLHALGRLRGARVDVLLLSFGCFTYDDRPSPLLERALGRFTGTVIVACAGNTASSRPFWPAALRRVVAVAALDAAEARRAPFSAHGPWVDACARGEDLTSSFVDFAPFRSYASWSGTSFSAALVAGAIAAAARHMPPAEAAAHVLDPGRGRRFPDLGVFVPTDR